MLPIMHIRNLNGEMTEIHVVKFFTLLQIKLSIITSNLLKLKSVIMANVFAR